MREIKFRAWDNKAKKWVTDYWYIDRDGTVCNQYDTDIGVDIAVMQSTGLKDRQDRDIYEGDIVRIGSKAPLQVRWHKDTAGFLDISMELMSNTEVIGNIYENPEFLQEGKVVSGQETQDH